MDGKPAEVIQNLLGSVVNRQLLAVESLKPWRPPLLKSAICIDPQPSSSELKLYEVLSVWRVTTNRLVRAADETNLPLLEIGLNGE